MRFDFLKRKRNFFLAKFSQVCLLTFAAACASSSLALELSPELQEKIESEAERRGQSVGDLLEVLLAESATLDSDSNLDALLSLSLESLLKVKIALPSKRAASSQHSPGTVTSFSKGELRNSNKLNLADLADITPGYSSYTIFGERVFETRGEKASSFENNKHRVLLDGIPINHARGMKAPSEEELSLFMANQVDFLRGPASALYGASAFLGVIDIQTISLDQPGNYFELRSGLGNKQGTQFTYGNAVSKGEKSQAKFFASHFREDASRTEIGGKDDPLHRNYDDQNSQMFYGVYEIESGDLEGLSVGNYFSQTRGGLGEFWQGDFSTEANQLEWETWVPYVKYERQLSEHVEWRSYTYYNQSREAGFVATLNRDGFDNYTGGNIFAEYDVRVEETALKSELDWQGNDGKGMIIGLEHDVRKQTGKGFDSIFINGDVAPPIQFTPANPSSKIKNSAAFFQYDDQIDTFGEGLDWVVGMRFDRGSNPDNVFTQWSPRLAFVQRFNESWGLKLMTSSALRAPNTKELLLNSSAIKTLSDLGANPDIVGDVKSETFRTEEVALAFNSSQRYFNLSLFRNKTEDSVSLQQTVIGSNTVNYFGNSEQSTRTKGVEIEHKEVLSPAWLLNAGYSYAKADTGEQGSEYIPDVPDQKFVLGASYLVNESLRLNYYGRYVNEFRSNNESGLPGFSRHDLNVQYDLSPSARLVFAVDNLLDSQDYFTLNGQRSTLMDSRSMTIAIDLKSH